MKQLVNTHVIHHRAPPLIWQDGFLLGNGFLSAMGLGGDIVIDI